MYMVASQMVVRVDGKRLYLDRVWLRGLRLLERYLGYALHGVVVVARWDRMSDDAREQVEEVTDSN